MKQYFTLLFNNLNFSKKVEYKIFLFGIIYLIFAYFFLFANAKFKFETNYLFKISCFGIVVLISQIKYLTIAKDFVKITTRILVSFFIPLIFVSAYYGGLVLDIKLNSKNLSQNVINGKILELSEGTGRHIGYSLIFKNNRFKHLINIDSKNYQEILTNGKANYTIDAYFYEYGGVIVIDKAIIKKK